MASKCLYPPSLTVWDEGGCISGFNEFLLLQSSDLRYWSSWKHNINKSSSHIIFPVFFTWRNKKDQFRSLRGYKNVVLISPKYFGFLAEVHISSSTSF